MKEGRKEEEEKKGERKNRARAIVFDRHKQVLMTKTWHISKRKTESKAIEE